MSRGVVEYYFNQCPEFVKLMNAIRLNCEPRRYSQLAQYICYKLSIPTFEIIYISSYLKDGSYEKESYMLPVTVLSLKERAAYLSDRPNELFESYFELINPILNDQASGRGVLLDLFPETTKDELISFIDKNWPLIKQSLNANFPNRKKLVKPIERLNDWLTIAEKVRNYKKKGIFTKEDFYADLADEYGIALSDVKKYAKHYRPLIDLKYPSFKSDEK